MGTYEVQYKDGRTEEIQHVRRVELEGKHFYFILKGSFIAIDKESVKGFGLISFDEE